MKLQKLGDLKIDPFREIDLLFKLLADFILQSVNSRFQGTVGFISFHFVGNELIIPLVELFFEPIDLFLQYVHALGHAYSELPHFFLNVNYRVSFEVDVIVRSLRVFQVHLAVVAASLLYVGL